MKSFLLLVLFALLTVSVRADCRCSEGRLSSQTQTEEPQPIPQKLCVVGTANPSREAFINGTFATLKYAADHDGAPFWSILVTNDTRTHFSLSDIEDCTQIWLVDFQRHYVADNEYMETSEVLMTLDKIGDWFKSRSKRPAVIADGRLASSIIDGNWALFDNYYINLKERDYGLVLASDHDEYNAQGLNCVAKHIGIKEMTGEWFGMDFDVDPTNPLMSHPKVAHNNGKLEAFTTVSEVPFGLQPNGMEMYAVGYFDERKGMAGISASFNTLKVFGKNVTELYTVAVSGSRCGSSVESGDYVELYGALSPSPSREDFSYEWNSNINGPLGYGSSLRSSGLRQGNHTVTFKVTDRLSGASAYASFCVEVRAPYQAPAERPSNECETFVYSDVCAASVSRSSNRLCAELIFSNNFRRFDDCFAVPLST